MNPKQEMRLLEMLERITVALEQVWRQIREFREETSKRKKEISR